jgi:type II secretory pathway pseudopilin PulG
MLRIPQAKGTDKLTNLKLAGGMRHMAAGKRRGAGGFSLVEVTVAIGIFAFVAVGVLGLLPTALKQREASALEARAVLIANELFSGVRAAPSPTNVSQLRDGPGHSDKGNFFPPEDLTQGPTVLGYPASSSVPLFAAAQNSHTSADADALWKGTSFPDEARANNISSWAKLEGERISPNLYRLTVEVRTPASAPLERSQVVSFSTLHYAP